MAVETQHDAVAVADGAIVVFLVIPSFFECTGAVTPC